MSDEQLKLDPFQDVLEDLRQGRMIILLDDANRENEGDLVVATEKITAQAIAFMQREARGLVCVSISSELATRLNVPLQVLNNNSLFQTQFTVSIDYKAVLPCGVTAQARAVTLRRLIDPLASADDFVSPGHVFPLVANAAGVLGRRGQTEGSFDLARICGFEASGVICEILNPDGSMARGGSLAAFAKQHKLKLTSVEEIVRYRSQHEVRVRQVGSSHVDTDFGPARAFVFADDFGGKEHLALVYGEPERAHSKMGPLVRIHSECLTGDVFGSRRCDCGEQLKESLKYIKEEGHGLVLYLRQEGRGIGLGNKVKAYHLQDQGHDTVEANLKLGFAADSRDYLVAVKMLNFFGIERLRLLTNNPHKFEYLQAQGIEVTQRLPVFVAPDELTLPYLETKKTKMGHWL